MADMPSLAILYLEPQLLETARELAAALGSDCLASSEAGWRRVSGFDFVLLLDSSRLALARMDAPRMLPVTVDLEAPALWRRIHEAGARRQDLARAIGLHVKSDLHVVDCTAGMGGDSAVLAGLGCTVTMIERNAVVAALLADGLRRARASAREELRLSAERMHLIVGQSLDTLRQWDAQPPDVVYIDPMFPERNKQAAVRKEMQFFHGIVGRDADAPEVLSAALELAINRVVVKRPRKAPPLGDKEPSLQIAGSSTRFDIYALRAMR